MKNNASSQDWFAPRLALGLGTRPSLGLGLLATLILATCVPGELRAPQAGDPAPPFTALALDHGSEFSSAELLGAPYLLNVWATWCAPCRYEMPELQQLHDAYSARGFQVVGVSVDGRSDGPLIQEFAAEVGVSFPLYHQPSQEIMDAYFLNGLPASFLVDAEGRIARKWPGQFHPMADDVRADVEALLES